MLQGGLGARRFLVRSGLFATIATVTFLVSLLLGGTSAYIASSATAGVRETLDSVKATDAGVRAQIRLADDASAQSAAVESVIERTFHDIPVVVDRTVQSSPIEAQSSGSPVSVVFAADASIEGRAILESGTWPVPESTPVQATVHALAAEALGLSVGDEIVLGEDALPVSIAGTWLPLDGNATYWFGESLVNDGEQESAAGPFLVAEADFASLPTNPFARWTVFLDVREVSATDLSAASVALSSFADAVRDESGLAASGFIFEGELAATLDSLERSADAIRGVTPVPTILIGVLGLMAIIQLSRLLAAARSRETDLLRARGASVAQLAGSSAVESLVIAVVPAALGAAGALAVTRLVSPGSAPWQEVALVAVIVAAAVVVALTGVASREASKANSRDKPRESGRATRAATLATLVFAIAAAGVSLWQFRLYGTPLVASAAGARDVDPIAVLAPSLSLLAWAVVSLALFAPLALAIERASTRSRRLGPPLAAQQVARRLPLFAVPVLLISLAAGGSTLAAGYAQTWTALSDSAGQLRNGGDVRVVTTGSSNVGSPATLLTSVDYAALDEVIAAAPVLVVGVETADREVGLVALDGASANAVISDVGGSLDTEYLESAIAGTAGIPLPDDAVELSIEYSTEIDTTGGVLPRQGETALTAWLADAQGALARVALESSATERGTLAGSAPLPAGVAPWSIFALDVSIQAGVNEAQYAFTVHTLGAETQAGNLPVDALPDDGWVVPPVLDQTQDDAGNWTATVSDPASDPGFVATLPGIGETATLRLMPATPLGEPVPVPTVVTSALADALAAETGTVLSLQLTGTGRFVEAEVVGTVPLLPGSAAGSGFGAVADLALVGDQLLRSSSTVPRAAQVWIRSDAPAEAAAAAGQVAGRASDVTTANSGSGNALLAAAAVGLWVGAAGSLVLAAAAVAAVVGALSSSRKGEVTVLRVLGLSSAQQAAGRRREFFLVSVFAGVLGVVGGTLVSFLVVPNLARSAVLDAPANLPAPVQFAVMPLLGLLAAFAAALAVVAWLYGARVERQARNASVRDDEL